MSMKGINLGAGKGWMSKTERGNNWIGLDKLEGKYLDEKTILPAWNEEIDIVYSSHFFEHIDNATGINLINESYRVLKKGGVIRILVPDFFKIYESIKQTLLTSKGDKIELLEELRGWMGNFDIINGKSVKINQQRTIKIDENFWMKELKSSTMPEFFKFIQSQIPKELDYQIPSRQHINWWDKNKLNKINPNLKFKYSKHGEGKIKLPLNKFDGYVDRRDITLYMEAIK